MNFATRQVRLGTALEILAACKGMVIHALMEEEHSAWSCQERVEGYRTVLVQLNEEGKALRMDSDAAIDRVLYFYGVMVKRALLHVPHEISCAEEDTLDSDRDTLLATLDAEAAEESAD